MHRCERITESYVKGTNGSDIPPAIAIVPGEEGSGVAPSAGLVDLLSVSGAPKHIVLSRFSCDVSAFLKALEGAAYVKSIALHTMDLVGNTFQALCELVTKNPSISILSIENIMQFSSAHLYQLADVVEHTSTLKIVNILCVYGAKETIPYDRLCHAMSVNTSITKFRVRDSPHVPEKIVLILKFMAMHNRMAKAEIPVYPEAKILVQNRGAWALHRLQFAGADDPASKKVADRAGLMHKTVHMLEAQLDALKQDLADLQKRRPAADVAASFEASAAVEESPASEASTVLEEPSSESDDDEEEETTGRKRRSTSTPTRRKSMRLAVPMSTVIRNGRSLRKTPARK